MSSILITGSTGFVGRRLVERLNSSAYQNVFCLSRRGAGATPGAVTGAVKFLCCELASVCELERQLAGVQAVVHLAAVTGKAKPPEYWKTNVEGTQRLLRLSQRLGVRRFLFVSSIAAKFPDLQRYPYGRSKQQAEEVVRSSGLPYVIIRPTIILGRGAAVLDGLARLATLPLMPVFGEGSTRVQPIDVDDLVDFLLTLLDSDRFDGQTLELGGPEVITVEELTRKIRASRGRAPSGSVHIPLPLVLPLLSVLERLAFSLVPFTAGQLSTFRFDGTIAQNVLHQERLPYLKTIDQMLAWCYCDDGCG